MEKEMSNVRDIELSGAFISARVGMLQALTLVEEAVLKLLNSKNKGEALSEGTNLGESIPWADGEGDDIGRELTILCK